MSADDIIMWDPTCAPSLGLGPSAVAIGVFDGVHVGHRSLFASCADDGGALPHRTLIVTFQHDPDEHFGRHVDKLLSDDDRLRLLARCSSGTVLAIPADCAAFQMEPEAFLDALACACEPVSIHVGEGFRFGRKAAGTLADIRSWGEVHSCEAVGHKLVTRYGAPVSATRIRRLLAAGEVGIVRELAAGRPHMVSGTVVHGRGVGTGMGFSTANVELAATSAMLPMEGVYGGLARVRGEGRGHELVAAVNVGAPKSFAEATCPLEVHLLDFEGDLYGRDIDVCFYRRIRDQHVFSDTDGLVRAVGHDIELIRSESAEWGPWDA